MRTLGHAACVIVLALTGGAFGATLDSRALFRSVTYVQSGPATTDVLYSGWLYEVETTGDFDGGELVYPGPDSPAPLDASTPNLLFYRSNLLPDLAALNVAAPFGTYSGTGTNSLLGTSVSAADVVYSADFWPNVPMLTAETYTGLQGLNPALPFAINLTDFGTVAVEPRVELLIFRGGPVSGPPVFDQFFVGSTVTSVLLPAGTLEPGQLYEVELVFQNNNKPGPEGDINFALSTFAVFNTAEPAAVPEPGTVLGGVLACSGIVLFHKRRGSRTGPPSVS